MRSRRERLARRVLILYPARWRARYHDELLALLGDCDVTAAVVFDVARGAVREWVREIARPPDSPADLRREPWINLVINVGLPVLLAIACRVQPFRTSWDSPFAYLLLLPILAGGIRMLTMGWRRRRLVAQATTSIETPDWTLLAAAGISRTECTIWLVAMLVPSALILLDPAWQPTFVHVFNVCNQGWLVGLVRANTKRGLVRRVRIGRLRRARFGLAP